MQNATPPPSRKLAALGPPSEIRPWYGRARGLSFKRDVQPVLDKYCVGCHNEKSGKVDPNFSGVYPDFTAKPGNGWNNFTPSYTALQPYVRRPGPESDSHMQVPMEWGADTSELIRKLKKGHHNVPLDAESWDRLTTWIDLNVPDHGTWTEHGGSRPVMKRRLDMRMKYANNAEDPEAILVKYDKPNTFVAPPAEKAQPAPDIRIPGWPFDAPAADKLRKETKLPETIKLDLGDGQSMELVLVPAGEFVMGEGKSADETPCRVKIDKPFYMGKTEVTNAQYRPFDAEHDTGVISFTNKDQSSRGWFINGNDLPVSRVNWSRAMAFCQWLSARSGKQITLPTEAQWEFACRAGTAGSFYFGDATADFSRFANLADASVAGMALRDSPKWHPRDNRFNDGSMLVTSVGGYQPNALGLHDMTGNVAEWTLSLYRPYPYQAGDGRNDTGATGPRVVRGGSWYDRPADARSASRWYYDPWRAVYNVGFRVIVIP
jgi:formylglycine-generating enzyme required for sulfatase activity